MDTALRMLSDVARRDPSVFEVMKTTIATAVDERDLEADPTTITGSTADDFAAELAIPGADGPMSPRDTVFYHSDYYKEPVAVSTYADGSEMISFPDASGAFGVIARGPEGGRAYEYHSQQG